MWQLLESLVEAGDTLACSAVTLTEIYAGVRPKEVAFTERFLEGFEHYERGLALGTLRRVVEE